MTLDEAIKHARETAEDKREFAKLGKSMNPYYAMGDREIIKCEACAEEHEQLADWLEELKELRANNITVEQYNMQRRREQEYGYEKGQADIIDKIDNIMSFHQEGLGGYWIIESDDWDRIMEEYYDR